MILENVLNLIFPIKCGICGKIGLPICNDCEILLKKYEINLTENDYIEIEKNIGSKNIIIDQETNYKLKNNKKQKINKKIKVQKIFLYKYDDIVRKLLINYKFNDASYLSDTFSYLIKNNKKIYDILKTYDIILPVPLHKRRKLERGYNQTELIARKLGLKYENNCLVKVKNIKPQSQNDVEKRKTEIKDVFQIQNIEKIKNKKVLILDDIYTTGSTADECIKNVSIATNKVGFASIARDYMKYY